MMGCMLLLILIDKFRKMKKLLWIIFLISGVASAQSLDSLATDTVAMDTLEKEPPPYYLGVFIDGGLSYEASSPKSNFFSVLGIGIQYNRWVLGMSRSDFQGTIQSFVVFPNTFELKYRYGGISIGYQFYQDDSFNLQLRAGFNKGDMVWRNSEDGQDFLRDEFNLLKIGLRGEFGRFRYIKPHASIGYQKLLDLTLSRLEQNDFSGLFVAAGIRIGYFNQ